MKCMLENYRRTSWSTGWEAHGASRENGTGVESQTQSFLSLDTGCRLCPFLPLATSFISLSLKTGFPDVPELCYSDLIWPLHSGPLNEQLTSSVQLPSMGKNRKRAHFG